MLEILAQAKKALENNEQFALIVKKGTFEKVERKPSIMSTTNYKTPHCCGE